MRGPLGGHVKRLRRYGKFQILLFALAVAGKAYASPDPRLTSLIPSGAQLVSGISASSFRGQSANFVLMTGNNKLDLADFYALTGSDVERHIHQVVFVAASDASEVLNQHSLLVSGNFNKGRLLKTAAQIGGSIRRYHGIEVAEIQPFERERHEFNEIRWLAVFDSGVIGFGSIALIQRELDRFLAHSYADELLVRRLSRLRSKDQTWCVLAGSLKTLPSPRWKNEIRSALAYVNAGLATEAVSADEFEFGLFYGRKVELEYFLSRASTEPGGPAIDPYEQVTLQPFRSTALLPKLNSTGLALAVHDIIAIPVPRFKEWLAKISMSSH